MKWHCSVDQYIFLNARSSTDISMKNLDIMIIFYHVNRDVKEGCYSEF